MKKQPFYIIILGSIILFLTGFSNKNIEVKTNLITHKKENNKDYSKFIEIKDLDPKKFIELFIKNYDPKKKLNFVTVSGDFPKDWVKKKYLEYLIGKINSEQKCCGYMNVFSSFISSENAEVGGFAIIFLKSYKENTKINLGLNSNPKIDKKEIEILMNWYKNKKTN